MLPAANKLTAKEVKLSADRDHAPIIDVLGMEMLKVLGELSSQFLLFAADIFQAITPPA